MKEMVMQMDHLFIQDLDLECYLLKNIEQSEIGLVFDTARDTFNANRQLFILGRSNAEETYLSTFDVDF